MVRIKKYLLSLTLALSILGWMSPELHASAAPANHVHEWGSYEWVESIIFEFDSEYLYTYEKDGHIFSDYIVTEWCRFYRECYCGLRGEYREGGRTRTKTVFVE